MYNKHNVFESSWNHRVTPVYRNIVFHETGPWCQKGWGPPMKGTHSSRKTPKSCHIVEGVQKLLPWRGDRYPQTPWERGVRRCHCDLYLGQQICWILTGPHFILAVHPRKPTEMKSRWGFPGGNSGKEPTCQCRKHKRHGLDPCVGKIPRRRKWQPTPVLLFFLFFFIYLLFLFF